MILYLLWETYFGFSSDTVDSRGIYKFQFIGVFDIVWTSETKDWLIHSLLPLLLICRISQ